YKNDCSCCRIAFIGHKLEDISLKAYLFFLVSSLIPKTTSSYHSNFLLSFWIKMATHELLDRLHTGDIEVGISEALQRHATRHVVPPKPISPQVLNFERRRPRWLRECVAEGTGVFFYVCVAVS